MSEATKQPIKISPASVAAAIIDVSAGDRQRAIDLVVGAIVQARKLALEDASKWTDENTCGCIRSSYGGLLELL